MHRHACPSRFHIPKPLLILLVHSGEVVHGGQEDIDLDDVVDGGAGFGEDVREVDETLFLLGDKDIVGEDSPQVFLHTKRTGIQKIDWKHIIEALCHRGPPLPLTGQCSS